MTSLIFIETERIPEIILRLHLCGLYAWNILDEALILNFLLGRSSQVMILRLGVLPSDTRYSTGSLEKSCSYPSLLGAGKAAVSCAYRKQCYCMGSCDPRFGRTRMRAILRLVFR